MKWLKDLLETVLVFLLFVVQRLIQCFKNKVARKP